MLLVLEVCQMLWLFLTLSESLHTYRLIALGNGNLSVQETDFMYYRIGADSFKKYSDDLKPKKLLGIVFFRENSGHLKQCKPFGNSPLI